MRILILGGGISAVQCVEELARLKPHDRITLISGTKIIKGVENTRKLSRIAEDFDVVEKDLHALPYTNVTAIQGIAEVVDANNKTVTLTDGSVIGFDKLCICTGAKPRRVLDHPLVLVLRDQHTVQELQSRLEKARTVILVGNGGIAMELAYALFGTRIIWVVKQGHIGDAFFDSDAAAFLGGELERSRAGAEVADLEEQNSRQHGSHLALDNWSEPVSVSVHKGRPNHLEFGHAVGPHWAASLPKEEQAAHLQLECNCTVSRIYEGSGEWPVSVDLSNGKTVEGDFIISAVGVRPNTDWLEGTLHLHTEDRGILVDRHMQSNVKDIYAAGDACCIDWPDVSPHWFQMRLWTQAKLMGVYAAHCMAGTPERDALSFSFELFTHVTRFLGMKVVLLGLYNGQKIPDSEAHRLISYSRCVEGPSGHFVRVLLHNNKMVGAVLIGETELEETFENLILDGLDLSRYGPGILDPDVEIDALFD